MNEIEDGGENAPRSAIMASETENPCGIRDRDNVLSQRSISTRMYVLVGDDDRTLTELRRGNPHFNGNGSRLSRHGIRGDFFCEKRTGGALHGLGTGQDFHDRDRKSVV